MGNTDFGYAITMLKQGRRMRRSGWNGKGMFLQLVRAEEWLMLDENFCDAADEEDTPHLSPWIGMVTADNHFVPWLASQTDMLAEDWEEAE